MSMQKIKDTDCFLPEILMIKESCNITGQDDTLVDTSEF